jgi:hypothetical protein
LLLATREAAPGPWLKPPWPAGGAGYWGAAAMAALGRPSTPVQAAPIAMAPGARRSRRHVGRGAARQWPRPLRRPATHSLTTAEAIFVALAAGRAIGPRRRPDAPYNTLARGIVRAADWDREPLFPILKRRMEMPFDRASGSRPAEDWYAGKAARTVLGGGRELNSRPYHVPQSQRKVVGLKSCNLLFGLTSGFPQMAGGAAWGKIDSNIRATNLIGDVITKMKRNHATRPI